METPTPDEVADMIMTVEPSKKHSSAAQAEIENMSIIIEYMRFEENAYDIEEQYND